MKRLILVIATALMVAGAAHATGGRTPSPAPDNTITIDNSVNNNQSQTIENNPIQEVTVVGGDSVSTAAGGDAKARAEGGNAASVSNATINTSTDFRTRTPPITTFPPYLPYWNHGGWGTIKAYFPNGPNKDDQVYERTFDPKSDVDQRQLRGVLESLPHDGPIEWLGGILNGVGAVFCGVDNYHHGRGFQIANSLVRERRRDGAPLLVFIDTNVDTNLLRKAGYAYVGKVGLEGNVDRNWDQVYDAAVAETLPWDVDILLVSGGMKGVTVGSNLAFPGAGGAYSQANYSVSMFGSVSSGITEGKGKAVLSADAYRFSPATVDRRAIPQSFFDKIRASIEARPQPQPAPTRSSVESTRATSVREFQPDFSAANAAPVDRTAAPIRRYSVPEPLRGNAGATAAPRMTMPLASGRKAAPRPTVRQAPPTTERKDLPGVEVSQRLWEMAAFDKNQMVEYVIIR